MNNVRLPRCWAEDLLARSLEHLEELAVGADYRQAHRVGVVNQRIPLGVELHQAAQVVGIGHLGIRAPMHELCAHGRYTLARHIAAGPHDDRSYVLRVMTQTAE